MLYRRSEGNALFLVSFVDSLSLGEVADAGRRQSPIFFLSPCRPRRTYANGVAPGGGVGCAGTTLLGWPVWRGGVFTVAEVAGVSGRPLEEVEEVFDSLSEERTSHSGGGA